MPYGKIMKESEAYVRWRNDALDRPTTTPGVPIPFAGYMHPVDITDDGRTYLVLPRIMPEVIAA